MKIFIDANYLIYLKYSHDDEIFDYCIVIFKKLEDHEPLTNSIVVDEVIWILNKKYRIELNEVFEFLDKVLNFVAFIPLSGEDYEIAKEIMLRYGLKPSDAIHVASMRKAGVEHVVSEDPDFDKVEWVRRVWIDAGKV